LDRQPNEGVDLVLRVFANHHDHLGQAIAQGRGRRTQHGATVRQGREKLVAPAARIETGTPACRQKKTDDPV
jgi:hypothetical protein